MPLPEEQRQRFVGNIERESERMQRLIDKLLELARLEKMPQLEHVELLSVEDILETIVESSAARLSMKHVKCELNADEGINILGDRFLLQQAPF